jgi:hypothetical protein
MMYELSKQPKWVQEEVASLERRVRELEQEVAELRSDEVIQFAGDLKWERPIGIDLPKSYGIIETLPQGTHVYLKTGWRGEYFTVTHRRHDMNVIEVRHNMGPLSVQPVVSNVINIKQEER